MAKARERSTTRSQNTAGGDPLVRSSWNWEKGIQVEVAIPGLVMKRESNKNAGPISLGRSAQGIAGKHSESAHFAVCIDNEGYKASLELGKLYRVLPDKDAQSHGLVRVIDESGEDYAYSINRFHSMKVPSVIERALLHTRR